MPKGIPTWVYAVVAAFVGYEVFLNPSSPIYYQTLMANLNSAAAVASGAATNISTTVNAYDNLIGPYSPDTSTPTGSTADSSLGPGNTSIEDIPISYYSNLLVSSGALTQGVQSSGYMGGTNVPTYY